ISASTGTMPQPYVTSEATASSSRLSGSGTVTKYHGAGPFQNQISPRNANIILKEYGRRCALRRVEIVFARVARHRDAIARPGLGEDAVDMRLDGVAAQEQRRGDLGVRHAAGDHAEDLRLALGESVGQFAPAGAAGYTMRGTAGRRRVGRRGQQARLYPGV